jgi:hypothetical protein
MCSSFLMKTEITLSLTAKIANPNDLPDITCTLGGITEADISLATLHEMRENFEVQIIRPLLHRMRRGFKPHASPPQFHLQSLQTHLGASIEVPKHWSELDAPKRAGPNDDITSTISLVTINAQTEPPKNPVLATDAETPTLVIPVIDPKIEDGVATFHGPATVADVPASKFGQSVELAETSTCISAISTPTSTFLATTEDSFSLPASPRLVHSDNDCDRLDATGDTSKISVLDESNRPPSRTSSAYYWDRLSGIDAKDWAEIDKETERYYKQSTDTESITAPITATHPRVVATTSTQDEDPKTRGRTFSKPPLKTEHRLIFPTMNVAYQTPKLEDQPLLSGSKAKMLPSPQKPIPRASEAFKRMGNPDPIKHSRQVSPARKDFSPTRRPASPAKDDVLIAQPTNAKGTSFTFNHKASFDPSELSQQYSPPRSPSPMQKEIPKLVLELLEKANAPPIAKREVRRCLNLIEGYTRELWDFQLQQVGIRDIDRVLIINIMAGEYQPDFF